MSKQKKEIGPDFAEKQPTPYLYDAPANVPFPGKHQSGKGGPSDCNNNGIDDSEDVMSRLVTMTGISVPVFNVIRNQNVPSLEVQILQSQAQEIDLLKLFKTESELSTLTLMSDQGILENQYMNYSKLDTYNIQNDYIVKEAIGGWSAIVDEEGHTVSEEVTAEPALIDNLITIRLLKKSDLERKVDNNVQLIDAMSVALAQIMGG